jgi:AcrR family transcriptional regulator
VESPARDRILAAAARQFAAFGYRRTNIADIAREAGMAAGTIYRYFANKEEVFRAVVRNLHDAWLERARHVLTGPGSATERLARLAEASVEFNRSNSLINSVFRRDDEIIFAPLLDELHDDLLRQNVAMLAEVVRDGIREGVFKDVDPERAAYILFIGGDLLANQTHHPYQEILPLYAEIIFHGLLRPEHAKGGTTP